VVQFDGSLAQRTVASNDLLQLVYWSKRTPNYSLASQREVMEILECSRNWNSSANITGALMCSREYFAQLLEGPRDAVLSIFYGSIKFDRRHQDIIVMQEQFVVQRAFVEWSMALVPYDDQQNMMLEPADGVDMVNLTKVGRSALKMLRYLVKDAPLSGKQVTQTAHLSQV